jgi:hypothetical protein
VLSTSSILAQDLSEEDKDYQAIYHKIMSHELIYFEFSQLLSSQRYIFYYPI